MSVHNWNERSEMGIINTEGNYRRASDLNVDATAGTVAAFCDQEATVLMKKSKDGGSGRNTKLAFV